MAKVGEGVDTEIDSPGIFYHVKLAPGVVFDSGVQEIVEGILRENQVTIIHPEPEGRDKGRVINMG